MKRLLSSFLQSPPERVTLTSGTKLGDDEVKSLLGAGGMGEVYRSRDSLLGQDVVIKVLPTLLSADSRMGPIYARGQPGFETKNPIFAVSDSPQL
jgi:serine/threonine protein kinase